jgi:hypothetical protein
MITLLWVIPLLVLVAVLAGMRGYQRGHVDGVREGIRSYPPVLSASSPVWSAGVPSVSYLLDPEGNVVTAADRYIAGDHPLT